MTDKSAKNEEIFKDALQAINCIVFQNEDGTFGIDDTLNVNSYGLENGHFENAKDILENEAVAEKILELENMNEELYHAVVSLTADDLQQFHYRQIIKNMV